tara:strand:+ start:65 stop:559 length:495 start_codon:yes stop_codon:yes gene_type:complete
MKEKVKVTYDSISPITMQECVIEEANEKDNTTSYLCMQSGYSSHEHLIDGSEFQKKFEKSLTELMISCKLTDDNKRAWYPTFMQTPFAMLYIDGTDKKTYEWKVASVVPLKGEERKQYPVIGKENEYHTSKLDVDNAKSFDKYNFGDALDELYSIVKGEYINED